MGIFPPNISSGERAEKKKIIMFAKNYPTLFLNPNIKGCYIYHPSNIFARACRMLTESEPLSTSMLIELFIPEKSSTRKCAVCANT